MRFVENGMIGFGGVAMLSIVADCGETCQGFS
jgi:hypothetical protein